MSLQELAQTAAVSLRQGLIGEMSQAGRLKLLDMWHDEFRKFGELAPLDYRGLLVFAERLSGERG